MARTVSSAEESSWPSGVVAAAASASSSVWPRPKITTSASVSSGIQSTRLLGSLPSAKRSRADGAASAMSYGALPLNRRPSRSATSTPLAVLKLSN